MGSENVPEHLRLYNKPEYFVGNRTCSGYDDYAGCEGVLSTWSDMLRYVVGPIDNVLDVGAAYGFVVENFRRRGVPAWGVEPSTFALSKVRLSVQPYVLHGALPDLPDFSTRSVPDRFDLVTCTEVLEHVPEELVASSLQALADRTDRVCIALIMLNWPGSDADEGHITLKSRNWWEAAWNATGLVTDEEAEHTLNTHPYAISMNWAGRLFARMRP